MLEDESTVHVARVHFCRQSQQRPWKTHFVLLASTQELICVSKTACASSQKTRAFTRTTVGLVKVEPTVAMRKETLARLRREEPVVTACTRKGIHGFTFWLMLIWLYISFSATDRPRTTETWGRIPTTEDSKCPHQFHEATCNAIHATFTSSILQSCRTDRHRSHAQFISWYVLFMGLISSNSSFITGLVKTHFYNIWVQTKILRPNHELTKLHELLADVSIIDQDFGSSFTYGLVFSPNIVWQTSYRNWCTSWRLPNSWPMAFTSHSLWPYHRR